MKIASCQKLRLFLKAFAFFLIVIGSSNLAQSASNKGIANSFSANRAQADIPGSERSNAAFWDVVLVSPFRPSHVLCQGDPNNIAFTWTTAVNPTDEDYDTNSEVIASFDGASAEFFIDGEASEYVIHPKHGANQWDQVMAPFGAPVETQTCEAFFIGEGFPFMDFSNCWERTFTVDISDFPVGTYTIELIYTDIPPYDPGPYHLTSTITVQDCE